MTVFVFLGALAASVLVFEFLSASQRALSVFGNNRLMQVGTVEPVKRRSTWDALLVALLPGRFDPDQARNTRDVVSLLRRAGYPYDTPGDFYAAAIRDFSLFLAVGGMLAGAMAAMDMLGGGIFLAAVFIFLGSKALMQFLDQNPMVEFQSLDKVFTPMDIGTNHRFVFIIPVRRLDLSGRIALHNSRGHVTAGPGQMAD